MRPNLDAVAFETMVQNELDDIGLRRNRSIERKDWRERADEAKLLGLCLSGGGIRSATFSLGVLQGLWKKSLLQRVDYLSTVSGGGYIGSWLQGLADRDGCLEALDPDRKESTSLHFLRKYSNYLAAHPGLSIDTAVIPVIWLRNAGLNQAIIIAAAFAAILTCYVPAYLRVLGLSYPLPLVFGVAFLLTLIAVAVVARNLKVVASVSVDPRRPDTGDAPDRIGYLVVIPLIASALLLSAGLIRLETGGGLLFASLAALHGVLQWRGGFGECFLKTHEAVPKGHPSVWRNRLLPLRAAGHVLWMSAASALATHGLLYLIGKLLRVWSSGGLLGIYRILAWGQPLIVLSLFVGVGLQIGLMGKDYPDGAREWLARVGAWLVACALGWAAVFTVALFMPDWLMHLWAREHPAAISAVGAWITSTIAAVMAGKSPFTGKAGENGGTNLRLDRIARYAPLIALPGFFIAIAYGVHAALFAAHLAEKHFQWHDFVFRMWPQYWDPSTLPSLLTAVEMLCGAIAVFLILSLRVNINEFSMHHFYKNRLVRCYLGASAERPDGSNAEGARRRLYRSPNRFTGFDPHDDILLASLTASGRERRCPFPILNATLTVTQGTELATQERKAKSWIFTPLFSGFEPERSRADEEAKEELSLNGYVPTEKILGGDLHLGTAMAISGAALNPGQGYHSSTQVAFLMTLFDVRLGWWIGNPRNRTKWARPGPKIALWPLIRELFGSLDERSPYLNLSDGGNFENLGLYELVKRRCRFIVAVDGEQDGDYEFNALGGAVRKCRTDFHAEIEIDPRSVRPINGFNGAHCAVGKIRYSEPDSTGYLLYIKASMTNDEPADVELYRRQFPDFPQQSTADQFFTESQFESYRRLGLHCVQTVLDFDAPCLTAPDLEARCLGELFDRAMSRWQAPPVAPSDASRHAEAYTKFLDAWAKAGTANFDPMIVENRPADFAAGEERTLYFLILDLLQLMEGVVVECGLDRSEQRHHPGNSGWIRIFQYWLGQKAVYAVWTSQRTNYRPQFRFFMDDLMAEMKRDGAKKEKKP